MQENSRSIRLLFSTYSVTNDILEKLYHLRSLATITHDIKSIDPPVNLSKVQCNMKSTDRGPKLD